MKKIYTFLGLIFFSLLLINYVDALDLPDLDNNGYLDISNCTELQSMVDNFSNHELVNNIDCSDTINWNVGSGFEPIGTITNKIGGSFKGNNFNITNLFINRSGTTYVGLFGATNGLSISNIGLVNVTIIGDSEVGAIVGQHYLASITNSFSTGNIYGNGDVGGIIGKNGNSGVSTSFSTANIHGGSSAGGLIGSKWGGALITNSYATGNVNGTSSIGGFIGYNYNGGSTISNSYATGNVNGSGSNIGGFVGYNYNQNPIITNSYATGNVTGNSSNDYIGLFAGWWRDGTFTNNHYYSGGTCSNVGAGECNTNGTGHGLISYFLNYDNNPMNMSISNGWNFITIWYDAYDDITYPLLRWPIDLSFPTYSNVGVSSTVFNDYSIFSILIEDDFRLSTKGYYIFSTNMTGIWENDTYINFTGGLQQWANVTKKLPKQLNLNIGYRWYFTDDAGKENLTSIYTLVTEGRKYENRVRPQIFEATASPFAGETDSIYVMNDSYRTTSYKVNLQSNFELTTMNFTIPDYNSSLTYTFKIVVEADTGWYYTSRNICGSDAAINFCIYNFTSSVYEDLLETSNWRYYNSPVGSATKIIPHDQINSTGFVSIVGNKYYFNGVTDYILISDISITWNSTNNPQEIYSFNNSLQTESLDFDVSVANYTRYLKIFKTAIADFGKMTFSGYSYLSSYTIPIFSVSSTENLFDSSSNYSQSCFQQGGESCRPYVDHTYTNTIDGEGFSYPQNFYYYVSNYGWFGVNDTNTAYIYDNYTLLDLSTENIKYYIKYQIKNSNLDISCFNNAGSWVSLHTNSAGGSPFVSGLVYMSIPSACLQETKIQLRHQFDGTLEHDVDSWTQQDQLLYYTNMIYYSPKLTVQDKSLASDELSSSINTALNSGDCDCDGCSLEGNYCLIPFYFNSSQDGGLTYNAFEVFYDAAPIYDLNTTLISPENNIYSNNYTQYFQCNATDNTIFDGNDIASLENITIRIYNSSNEEIHSETKNTSGFSNSTIFNHTFSKDDTYLWSCESYNNIPYFNLSSSNYTLTLDINNPSISILNTSNNNSYYNKNNIFINVSASDANFKNITYNLYNSTGAKTTSSYSSLTTTKTFTSLDLDIYKFNVVVCDLADNCNTTQNQTVTLSGPSLSIISPADGSQYNVWSAPLVYTVSNVSNCYYNLTSGSLSSTNNEIVNCTSKTLSFAADALYTLDLWVVDYLGNIATDTTSFTIEQESGTGGGGGGGTTVTVVIGDNESQWSMSTETGGEKYTFIMNPGDTRTKSLIFKNLGETIRPIYLRCESDDLYICDYVSFSSISFDLPVLKDIETAVDFTLELPDIAEKKDYNFNIIATDDFNKSAIMTVTANVGTSFFLTGFASKFFTSKNIGGINIPYSLLFFSIWIVSGILIFFIAFDNRKMKGGKVWSMFIGLGLSSIAIIFL